ncbi:MAG: class I SAM-dependent methyltransferase [Burkholderiales bacterium]|nr:class I SAM-dependent methyltransferase [Burkholderiales bacterium]
MNEATAVPAARRAPTAGGALARYLGTLAGRSRIPFRVVFSDGAEFRSGDLEPAFTLRFRTRRAQLAPALFGHLALLEAYFDGELDVDGDFALVFRAGMDASSDASDLPLVRLRNWWHEARHSNASIARAKANAEYHYDLPYDFYRRWLDREAMMYTCGYWCEGTTTVEEAQVAKIDHVCRKVNLKPGETFVDVGCGFGGLLFRGLERFGAFGTGINTASRQVAGLRREVERRGLADRIKVVECDFRQIPGQYDKLLSIGSVEHAGRDQLSAVIKGHADAMKPGALGLIHFIGHVGRFPTEFYIRKHIFPGGWIPSLAEAIEAMEQHGLEVVDVENLRRHYALTLDAWATRFDANWEAIHAQDPVRFDEHFRRKWRAYLWSCAEMFRSPKGTTHLFQVLVAKGNIGSRYPMSRAFLYRTDAPAPT